MKDIISRNWKKILKLIGCFIIFIIFMIKLLAPKTLIKDYIKYGKDINPSNYSILDKILNNINPAGSPLTPEIFRLIIVMVVGIFIVLILSMIASAGGKDGKKK